MTVCLLTSIPNVITKLLKYFHLHCLKTIWDLKVISICCTHRYFTCNKNLNSFNLSSICDCHIPIVKFTVCLSVISQWILVNHKITKYTLNNIQFSCMNIFDPQFNPHSKKFDYVQIQCSTNQNDGWVNFIILSIKYFIPNER